mmetsp:Transcript_24114/g.52475  ORF Transcript_24114/g.52475 Transcript_24114/m.52475 type:complete len:183 (-) Transcript_24114:125-673(-)
MLRRTQHTRTVLKILRNSIDNWTPGAVKSLISRLFSAVEGRYRPDFCVQLANLFQSPSVLAACRQDPPTRKLVFDFCGEILADSEAPPFRRKRGSWRLAPWRKKLDQDQHQLDWNVSIVQTQMLKDLLEGRDPSIRLREPPRPFSTTTATVMGLGEAAAAAAAATAPPAAPGGPGALPSLGC